jgi:hypothetical protein
MRVRSWDDDRNAHSICAQSEHAAARQGHTTERISSRTRWSGGMWVMECTVSIRYRSWYDAAMTAIDIHCVDAVEHSNSYSTDDSDGTRTGYTYRRSCRCQRVRTLTSDIVCATCNGWCRNTTRLHSTSFYSTPLSAPLISDVRT